MLHKPSKILHQREEKDNIYMRSDDGFRNRPGRMIAQLAYTRLLIASIIMLLGLGVTANARRIEARVSITTGPDGSLWIADHAENQIIRVTTAGVATTFPTSLWSRPAKIVSGPDGALWFTLIAGNKIGRITTAGVITEFTIPTLGSRPLEIAAGPDGALWFTLIAGNKIGRITTAGVITEFTIPTLGSRPLE